MSSKGELINHKYLYNYRRLKIIAEGTKVEIEAREQLSVPLYKGLTLNRVVFNKDFDKKTRQEKLRDLCRVLGIYYVDETGKTVEFVDPDPSYELTYDNVMKLLAIHMRFRANIPVVIMGETGSGKTRMIRFLCDLMKGRAKKETKNMLILKTHSGINGEIIWNKVEQAEKLSEENYKNNVKQTILFFDEANTTSHIGTIKAVMCDKMVNGRPINVSHGLKFVAAVNPYREHSEEMIKKLEDAGLGYHVRVEETKDKIGSIPMRRLVYRVKEIPMSMFPLVFDFGELDTATEKKYIAQMVDQKVSEWEDIDVSLLNTTLSASQDFMRGQEDECSFVSLRDVQR